MTDSLRSKTAANLGYTLLTRSFVFTLSSATGIILARHLSTSDYGIVGFASIFVTFLGMFNDLGVTPSIIQKETIEANELYTAFTLKLLLGVLIFLISFGWGSLSQKAFDIPAVKAVIIVLASCSFIDALGFLPTTLLSRELQFKRLTVPQIGGQIAATIVAVTSVYLGARYWSLVFSTLASTVVSAAIVVALRPTRFRIRWDRDIAREHLMFGSHLFFAGLMVFVLFNADNFVVGAMGGAAMLGFYSIAFNWGSKISGLISAAIHGVLLSTFSRLQHETERLKRGYLTILEYVAFAAVLANVLLLILSRELLTLVLGAGTDKWLPALTALRILCVYGIIRSLLEPVGSIIVAIGRPSLISKSNTIVAVLQAACLYPAQKYFGIMGVSVVVVVSYAVQFLVYFPALRDEIGLRVSAVLRSVCPAMLSGCFLAAFGLAFDRFTAVSWFFLAVKLVLGCVLYVVTYGLATRWKIIKEARQIFRESTLIDPACSK
jgi:O-antigen/teichoic acid export membrane protein